MFTPAMMRAMMELPTPKWLVGADYGWGQSESRIHRSGSDHALVGHRCEFMIVDETTPRVDFHALTKSSIEEARHRMSQTIEREIGRHLYGGVTIQNP